MPRAWPGQVGMESQRLEGMQICLIEGLKGGINIVCHGYSRRYVWKATHIRVGVEILWESFHIRVREHKRRTRQTNLVHGTSTDMLI